jgi:hypothetical protein
METMFLSFRILTWTIIAPVAMRLGPARAFTLFAPKKRDAATKNRPSRENLVALADRILLFRVFGRLLFRTRCYKRTLVLFRLLRMHGYDAVAWIGLDLDRDGLAGHAWLTVDDARIVDPTFTPERDFTPFLAIGDRVERFTGA